MFAMPPALELLEPSHLAPELAATADSPLIERRAGLTRRQFEREYSLPRKPVILTDATRNWRARSWTLESLATAAGHCLIEYREGRGKVRFGDLIEQIATSSSDAPVPYGRNIHVFRDLPEVADDIRPRIEYCVPDWKSSRLLPRDWLFENGLEELFIGGCGVRFPCLHVDYWGMDAYLSQLVGVKDVLVFSPADTPYLYTTAENPLVSSINDFDNPDLDRFPLYRRATPIRFRLQPGETLFCPNGWWHTTSMPGPSVTLVTANWCRANWPEVIRQYAIHRRDSAWLKRQAAMAYFQLVGAVLGMRDRCLLGL
jgi:histone arginine demethylase JMJD6